MGTVYDQVLAKIGDLQERNKGVSLQKLKLAMDLDKAKHHLLRSALKKGVTEGTLSQVKSSYRLKKKDAVKKKKAPAKKKTVKKTATATTKKKATGTKKKTATKKKSPAKKKTATK